MKMFPENYIPMMYLEFDDGDVLYYEPFSFCLLSEQFRQVKQWERIMLPKDAIELRMQR